MVHNLRMFQILAYASIAVGILGLFFSRDPLLNNDDAIIMIVVFILLLLLVLGGFCGIIWAAARGHKWAGWLLVVLLIYSLLDDLYRWFGGPAWFDAIFVANESDTISSNVIGLLSTILLAAAMVFYFRAMSRRSNGG